MTRFPDTIRRLAACAASLFASLVLAAAPPGTADQHFTTPPALSIEAKTLVGLLEEAQYNHNAVQSGDYGEVVPDYMAALDGQHLLYLNSDKVDFAKRFGNNVYWNLATLGNLDPAYEMFAVYQTRATARIHWVFEELKKDFDLTANETYRADRSKSEWPATAADSDDLWRKRLKFEIVAELLNKKSLPEAKEIVRKRYDRMLKNVAELDGGDLAELYLGSAAQLYDPHSTYFSADTFEDFGIQMKLELVGIGALLNIEDDNCKVAEIVPGGPADLGHQLKPHDTIISVAQDEGEPVEIIGMKLRKIVDLIRGAKGSRVRLIVQPSNATDTASRKTIIITRDVVKLNSARAHAALFQVPGADGKTEALGVITLPAFYGPADEGDTDADKSGASQDVANLLGQLKQKGMQGLVLDLRHNGGGFLTEAIDLTGLFIHAGPVVQVKDYLNSVQVDSEKTDHLAYDGPLAVLVDRFSASASEIVAGALQDYGRAVIVGDRSTHGKGTVQTVVEMKNVARQLASTKEKTGAAKITIQKFYLPDGSSTQLKGVVPDIILPSVNEFLPIGESDLPHALPWDHISTSFFDGAPLSAKVLQPLQKASLLRQQSLEEFDYLRRNVDWFKMRQAQKLVSLNLVERRKQKEGDEAFRKATEAERTKLAKNDFAYVEFRLGPPRPPKVAAPKSEDDKKASDDDSEDNDDVLDSGDSDAYAKVDVDLREALRIVDDAVTLGRNPQTWASDHAPLTVASKG